jgi:hypothetical protein
MRSRQAFISVILAVLAVTSFPDRSEAELPDCLLKYVWSTVTDFGKRPLNSLLSDNEAYRDAYVNGSSDWWGSLMMARHPVRGISSFYRGLTLTREQLLDLVTHGLSSKKKVNTLEPWLDVSFLPGLAMDYVAEDLPPGEKRFFVLVEMKPDYRIAPGMHWTKGHLRVLRDVPISDIKRVYIFDPTRPRDLLPFAEFTPSQIRQMAQDPE